MAVANRNELRAELDTLSEDTKRAQLAMQTALQEMHRIEARRKEIEALLFDTAAVVESGLKVDNEILQTEVAELRSALARTSNDVERAERDRGLEAAQLRQQLDDMQHGLAQERLRNTLLQQEAGLVGYPVVGLELSEGAPYDIDGVWVVSVVRGGPADKAGIQKGDVVSEVSGVPVPSREAFRKVILGGGADGVPTKPGHQMSFRIHREDPATGQPVSLSVMVTLGWSSRRPEGRRSITVTRSSAEPAVRERSIDTTPARRSVASPATPSSTHRRDRSTSPVRQTRFL